jgi:hypothetical protein
MSAPEEDPNAVVPCSSPPCFRHELEPSRLGYLGCDEGRGLLAKPLAALTAGAGSATAGSTETGESRCGKDDLLAVPGLGKDGNRVSPELTIVPLRGPDGRMGARPRSIAT